MVRTQIRRTDFLHTTEHFIKRVIQHRRKLISIHKSDINRQKATLIMEYLSRHLNSVLFTQRGMAIFFLKNQENIKYLIRLGDEAKYQAFEETQKKALTYQYL